MADRRVGRLVNLTPHPIVVLDADGGVAVTVEPSGCTARLSTEQAGRWELVVDGATIEVSQIAERGPAELPEAEPGVYLVVSSVVAAARPGRPDLLVPDDLVRDVNGAVIGCRRFAQGIGLDHGNHEEVDS